MKTDLKIWHLDIFVFKIQTVYLDGQDVYPWYDRFSIDTM